MKKIIFKYLFLFLSISNFANAQNDTLKSGEEAYYPAKDQSLKKDRIKDTFLLRKNSIYFEQFGNAFLGASLNYERILLFRKDHRINIRIGFLAPIPWRIYFFDYTNAAFGFLGAINLIEGKRRYFFELGLGCTSSYYCEYDDSIYLSFSGNIGYRYEAPFNRFLFRVAFTPIFALPHPADANNIIPWIGMSAGYRF